MKRRELLNFHGAMSVAFLSTIFTFRRNTPHPSFPPPIRVEGRLQRESSPLTPPGFRLASASGRLGRNDDSLPSRNPIRHALLSGLRENAGGGLLCALLLALLFGCDRSASPGKAEPKRALEALLPVAVTPVRAQSVARTVEFVGTLHANEEVTVSSEVDGRIAALTADLGDRVVEGQALAKIQDAEFRFAIQQTQGSLGEILARLGVEKTPPPDFDVTRTSLAVRAKAEMDDAESALRRAKALHDRQLIAAQEYDTAEMRAKTARATHANMLEEARALIANANSKEAQLETARKKLSDTSIAAPLGGSISKRFVSVGEYVKAGASMFTIVQDQPLKLRGMIPERFSPDVRAGQGVELRVDSFPDATFKGRLTRISPSSEVASRSFLVEGVVENPDRRLKPGFFAHAIVATRVDPNALTVPQQAIVSFAGVSKVFVVAREPNQLISNTGVESPCSTKGESYRFSPLETPTVLCPPQEAGFTLNEKNVARERIVQTGVRVGANDVEVTGLKPGELVAISGLTRLTNGAAVKVSGPAMPREGDKQQP